jgi:hypothetical protein
MPQRLAASQLPDCHSAAAGGWLPPQVTNCLCAAQGGAPCFAPSKIWTMPSGFALVQMTMQQPPAVAMRAAVSFVTIPPVPHWVPLVLVSAVREEMSCTSWMGVAVGSSCRWHSHSTSGKGRMPRTRPFDQKCAVCSKPASEEGGYRLKSGNTSYCAESCQST